MVRYANANAPYRLITIIVGWVDARKPNYRPKQTPQKAMRSDRPFRRIEVLAVGFLTGIGALR